MPTSIYQTTPQSVRHRLETRSASSVSHPSPTFEELAVSAQPRRCSSRDLMKTILTAAIPLISSLASACTRATSGASDTGQRNLSLDQPDASYPTPFSRLSGFRELPNGKVMVTDGQEKQVLILDFASGTSRKV